MTSEKWEKPTVTCISLPTIEGLAGNWKNESCADSALCSA